MNLRDFGQRLIPTDERSGLLTRIARRSRHLLRFTASQQKRFAKPFADSV